MMKQITGKKIERNSAMFSDCSNNLIVLNFYKIWQFSCIHNSSRNWSIFQKSSQYSFTYWHFNTDWTKEYL